MIVTIYTKSGHVVTFETAKFENVTYEDGAQSFSWSQKEKAVSLLYVAMDDVSLVTRDTSGRKLYEKGS